jgi:hypothetical protein
VEYIELYGDIDEFKTGYQPGTVLRNYNVVALSTKRLWKIDIACNAVRFFYIPLTNL